MMRPSKLAVSRSPLRRFMNALALALGTTALLGASPPASATAQLFASLCSGCHNDVVHPKGLVYNAAGNAAIITMLNATGMGAAGSPADFASIATYLAEVEPTITLAPVAYNSPGTAISLRDIKVSASVDHAYLKIISSISSVTAPKKGTVTYKVGLGFLNPSIVTYTPFPGQSGLDTWTYQGSGNGMTTTVRTASVFIGAPTGPAAANYTALWWNPAESGWGVNFNHQGNILFGTLFTYDAAARRCGW